MSQRRIYLDNLKSLSDQLIAAQAPIRILDSIKWPPQWRQRFFDSDMRWLPNADTDYYQSQPLNFQPAAKQEEFKALKQSIKRKLGKHDPLGKLLTTTTDQYIQVVDEDTLIDIDKITVKAVMAMAVFVGQARLIDNMRLLPGEKH